MSYNREFLQLLASLGIAAGSVAATPAVAAGQSKTEVATTIKIPLGKLDATVKALCAKLGDDSFKVRKASTVKLIQIGEGRFSTATERDSAKSLVLKTVEGLARHKDPEVRRRASAVKAALVEKKVVPPPQYRLKGDIAL